MEFEWARVGSTQWAHCWRAEGAPKASLSAPVSIPEAASASHYALFPNISKVYLKYSKDNLLARNNLLCCPYLPLPLGVVTSLACTACG